MYLQTKTDLCRNVAHSWFKHGGTSDKKAIYDKLLALDGHGTEDTIAAIIGNRSWTLNTCHECKADSPVLVHLGEKPDYDAAYVYVCPDCLRKALEMATGRPLATKEGER